MNLFFLAVFYLGLLTMFWLTGCDFNRPSEEYEDILPQEIWAHAYQTETPCQLDSSLSMVQFEHDNKLLYLIKNKSMENDIYFPIQKPYNTKTFSDSRAAQEINKQQLMVCL